MAGEASERLGSGLGEYLLLAACKVLQMPQ